MKKLLFVSLFTLLNILSAWAYDFEVDGIYYNIILGTSTEVEVIFGTDRYFGMVVIPATVVHGDETYNVTAIGGNAFASCSGLTSVTIPEGVTSIGYAAFVHCSSLTSLMIPSSVALIEDAAFKGCSSLTSVYYGGSISQWCSKRWGYHHGYVFDRDYDLYINNEKVVDLVIPNSVDIIEPYAFQYCGSLTSVVIPNSVTAIGDDAFGGCSSLTSVVIPNSVTAIGYSAFEGCSGLTSVTIPNSVTTIRSSAFDGCSGLTSLTLPESVTTIEYFAFAGCSGLTSLVLPESVLHIEYAAFFACSGLTSVTIPGGITSIGNGAFERCTGLPSVTIPEGVDSIGAYAFYGCSSLATVSIPESVTYIGEKAFDSTAIGSPLHNTTVFAKMPEDYSGGYTIPDGIQTIADGAFSGCSGLNFLAVIPESVIAIGAQAFYGCSGLKSVTLPVSLDTIGKYAFAFCDSLMSVISLAAKPPYCVNDDSEGDATFSVHGQTFSVYGTLYVPRGSKAAYQAAPVWRDFDKIEEIETTGTCLVTVRVNDESMGRVEGGGEYASGEQIILEAIPGEGYHFVKWDDGNTDNPRPLAVISDITLTATFAKNETEPSEPTDPSDPTDPTANESALTAAPIAYVQGRTAYLADGLGEVEAFTATGQRVYRGTDRTITLPRPGIYVLRVVADGRRCKVIVK